MKCTIWTSLNCHHGHFSRSLWISVLHFLSPCLVCRLSIEWISCDASWPIKWKKTPGWSHFSITVVYYMFSAHFKFHYDNHMHMNWLSSCQERNISLTHERKDASLLLLPNYLKIMYRLGTCSLSRKRENIKIHRVFKMKTNTHCHKFNLSFLISRMFSLGNFITNFAFWKVIRCCWYF